MSAECGVRRGIIMSEHAQNRLLLERTKAFAFRIIRLCKYIPDGRIEQMITSQLMRCGTSVGANYRAACRARSAAEFRAKLGIVEEEADESIYWMELIAERGTMPIERLQDLISEANEILAMVVASIRTSRASAENSNSKGI